MNEVFNVDWNLGMVLEHDGQGLAMLEYEHGDELSLRHPRRWW